MGFLSIFDGSMEVVPYKSNLQLLDSYSIEWFDLEGKVIVG